MTATATAHAPAAAHALTGNVWKLYAMRFLFFTHFIASVLIPFFRDWGGISFTRIFVLNTWFALWTFLLEVPTGTVADFWSRKASIVLGCAVGAVASLVYGSTPHFGVFLVGEVLFACSLTLLSGADEALLYDSLVAADLTAHSRTAFARLESVKLAGLVAGALLGSVIATRLGVRMPMLLQCLPMTAAALVAMTLREPTRAAQPGRARSYRQTLVEGVRYFLAHRLLRLLAFDMIVTGAVSWMIIWLYQPLLEAAGVGLVYFGAVHALMALGQIGVLSSVPWFERLVGSKRRLLLVGPVIVGVAFLTLGMTTATPLVVLAIIAASSFGLSRAPLFSSYLNQQIPSDRRATVLSAISMFRTLAITIINPIVGRLVDWSLHGTLLVLGVAALVLALVSRLEDEHLVE